MQEGKVTVEIVKNKLFYMISDKAPKDIPKAFYFNIDNDLEYDAFFEDFGPLNLAKIWKYTSQVLKIMKDERYAANVFYHQTSTDYKKNTNSALLICCYQMIVLGRTAEQAWKPFEAIAFKPFRDASYGKCSYECTILDCLRGLQYATKLGWFDFKTFNISEYENYERVENGDLNWIIPGKFVAFSSPSGKKKDSYGNTLFMPKDYLPIFKHFGVNAVIRLSTKTYERQDFIDNGIAHHDMYFTDGTSPPPDIVEEFLNITEDKNGVFAVHCKAGLGRTGSLIGCYAMKHFKFNAADFIGWIRLCRPGSILGPQQYFMLNMEKQMKSRQANSPQWLRTKEILGVEGLQLQMKHMSIKHSKMSEEEKKISTHGDKGQGEHLVGKKLQASKA